MQIWVREVAIRNHREAYRKIGRKPEHGRFLRWDIRCDSRHLLSPIVSYHGSSFNTSSTQEFKAEKNTVTSRNSIVFSNGFILLQRKITKPTTPLLRPIPPHLYIHNHDFPNRSPRHPNHHLLDLRDLANRANPLHLRSSDDLKTPRYNHIQRYGSPSRHHHFPCLQPQHDAGGHQERWWTG